MNKKWNRVKVLPALVIMAAVLTVAGGVVRVGATSVETDPLKKTFTDDVDMSLVFSSEIRLDTYVDGEWSGSLSDEYGYGDTASLTAPVIDEKTFSHWEADGSVISYSNPLKLTMNAHTTLYAVYESSAPSAQPAAGFTSITRTDDGTQISFQAIADPNGGTVDGAGIVYSTTAAGDDLIIGGTGVTDVAAVKLTASTDSMPASVLDKNNCWMLQVTPEGTGTVYHARAYVTAGGNTTYGDVKDVKLSELSSGISMIANLDGFDPEGSLQDDFAKLIPATGHHYNETSPVWSWVKNDKADCGYDVTVQFKCKDCGDIVVPETQPTVTAEIVGGEKTITATVEFNDDTYTASKSFAASYNITVNGKTTQYKYAQQVKAVAPAAPDGKYFDGWYEGNTKVSGSETYYFYAFRDTSIEAIYAATEVEEAPVLSMNVSNREVLATGKNKVSFIYDWELPAGYTLEKAAIVRSYTETNPTIDTADTNVKYTSLKTARGTFKLNLTISTANVDKTVHVCGYIKYKDKSGVSHDLYTNVFTSAPAYN